MDDFGFQEILTELKNQTGAFIYDATDVDGIFKYLNTVS